MWEKVKLFDICRPKQWKTISTNNLESSGFPVYGANGKIGFYNIYTHEFPTLAITCRGATCGSLHITEPKSYINGNAMALDNLSPTVSIKYLYYSLKTRGFHDAISGSAQPQITREGLEKIEIPLPPLPIQEKIAAILDKADALRRKDQELLKKYDELAQAIFIDMFGDPVKNEKGWEVKRLGEVCSKIGSGSTPKGGKEAYKSKGISLIRSLNIHQNEFKYKDLAFIDDEQAYLLRNVIVEPNDVLFNITGASVCRTTIVPDQILPARVNQHVAILRPNQLQLKSDYFVRLLNNQNMNRLLYGIATQGGATREAITKEQLEKLEIPIPPLQLQETFTKKIELINQLKAQTNAEKSEELFQSLLQRAFKGELVR